MTSELGTARFSRLEIPAESDSSKTNVDILTAINSQSGRKSYRSGTHRTVAPAETLKRVRPLMAPMGITRIANVTGLDRIGIPVVMVCRPNSRSIAVSQGKGVDLIAAKVSGLMEAIETYHAEHISLPLKFGTYNELCDSHRIIDVTRLALAANGRYDEHLSMLWIEGRNLMDEGALWLPYEVVSANYTRPFPPGSGCFAANTNGLGSGNHLLEAISHGLCEVIERDATTLWNRRAGQDKAASGLNLDSVDDPLCRELLNKFERADIEVRVWEVTSDVEIAAFSCLIMDRQDGIADPELGHGCHPAREVALLRALTEAAQARTSLIAGSRDDLTQELYDPTFRANRLHHCRALMDCHSSARDFRKVPTWDSEAIANDLAEILRRLQLVGIEQVAVVNLTQPSFGLPVVRVVVPGLEGTDHDPSYTPGARARAEIAQ